MTDARADPELGAPLRDGRLSRAIGGKVAASKISPVRTDTEEIEGPGLQSETLSRRTPALS